MEGRISAQACLGSMTTQVQMEPLSRTVLALRGSHMPFLPLENAVEPKAHLKCCLSQEGLKIKQIK